MARITKLPSISSEDGDVPAKISSFNTLDALIAESTPEPMRPLVPRTESELEGEDADEDEESALAPAHRAAVIKLSAADIDEENVEDFTAGEDVVNRVLHEADLAEDGQVLYKVEFQDFHVEEIAFDDLLQLDNGQASLEAFQNAASPDERAGHKRKKPKKTDMVAERRTRPRQTTRAGYVDSRDAVDDPNDFGSEVDQQISDESETIHIRRSTRITSMGSEDGGQRSGTRHTMNGGGRETRAGGRNLRGRRNDYEDEIDDESSSDELASLESDLRGARKRKRKLRSGPELRSDLIDEDDDLYVHGKRIREGVRQSGRATRHQGGMQEVDINDIYRSDSNDGTRVPAKPKAVAAKESFKVLPRNDEFRMRHMQTCEVCTNDANYGPLVYCQGCTLAYHKNCLGHRTNREHLVTKVDNGDFVLQCRRCVAIPRKKDHTAPDQGKCQDCHEKGASCRPFRPRKTTAQEQKDRDDNEGEDPAYEVNPELINNADNVMFRCTQCWRGFHFQHLPSRTDVMDMDNEVDADQRFREYSREWTCKECANMPAKVVGLIAWKPIDEDTYDPALDYDMIEEDEKAYLVKWDGMSYFRAAWMPGPWVWGVTPSATRKAFAKKEDARFPKMRTEDAIPEDYLRTDIVLDIRFTSIVDIRTDEIDKARIREVDKALIKYKGLGCEDAVWEQPPSPEDGDRWTDFVTAYNDWVLGRYVRQPKQMALKARLEKARAQPFAKLERKTQPENLTGGELMKYQIEGLNWLYFKWYSKTNAILADEMGLGKTIQIIGLLATLVQDWNCTPFLVVVPNSTCPNWRREIKQWAPSLRVVAFYGSKESRDMAYRYELYPEGSKDLRCHIVVTSYDAAADDSCRKFFRSVPWQGLIVDEGQRLKNDKNLLYSALSALKVPFKILLTGTPLQNNQRELFNLLHFLDDSYDAAALEEEYADKNLDNAKIAELHDKIKPFFLRRTKAQVLTFLPPMAQLIVPISMSVVQKQLYKSIMAKDPNLMRAIFSTEANLKQAERANINNILMQLRKCLCHPFVYSADIEDRNLSVAASHRNLIEAGAKLQLLDIMLPKMKERGHRVLIFSQFLKMLDMVEDFLGGLGLAYQRLDGQISSMQKQKRIDEFNAPDSPLFAFLLSTRAGGVGINLATADSVIILDPDFNPHQDIQALSRAHRIGQHKKVMCFQFVTRASAEERIAQIGRKKMALEKALIGELGEEDASEKDLASVLRHGAEELFNDDGSKDIVYDSASVDRLLDRAQMEDTKAGNDKSAESQFSFARVWANDSGALQAALPEAEDTAPDPSVWANILKERQRLAAEEAARKESDLGRGRRARQNVDYAADKTGEVAAAEGMDLDITPVKIPQRKRNSDESDTDFQAEESEADIESGAEDGMNNEAAADAGELASKANQKAVRGIAKDDPMTFRRVTVPIPRRLNHGFPTPPDAISPSYTYNPNVIPTRRQNAINCFACQTIHSIGSCPLKMAGLEYCNLCGMAHYGHARVCPHIQSETQVRAMLEALRTSNEPQHLIQEARRYLTGVKGSLVQQKKAKAAKEATAKGTTNANTAAFGRAIAPVSRA